MMLKLCMLRIDVHWCTVPGTRHLLAVELVACDTIRPLRQKGYIGGRGLTP